MSKELPAGWAYAEGRQAFQFVRGVTYRGEQGAKAARPGDVRLVRATNIQDGRLDFADPIWLAPDLVADEQLLREGDVVVATSSGSISVVGKTAAFRDTADGVSTTFGAFCGVLRPLHTINPRFLFWLTQSPNYRAWASEQAAGVNINNLKPSALLSLALPLPPLAEQRRIVTRIEAVFARTLQARADLLRISLLARLFRDRTLAEAFDADWPEASIADLAEATFDGPFGSNLKSSDYTSKGTRVVRLENIGHLNFIDEKETFISIEKGRSLARHTLRTDDVLFSSFVDREVRVCRLPDHLVGKAINKADCFCIRVDRQKALPAFVEKRLASPVTHEDMREAVHGATRPRIGLGNLKAYRIGLPTIEAQTRTVAAIELAHSASRIFEQQAARALGPEPDQVVAAVWKG